jgi:hypothetical protein
MSEIEYFHESRDRSFADPLYGCRSFRLSQRQNSLQIQRSKLSRDRHAKVRNPSLRAGQALRKSFPGAGTTTYSRNHSAYLGRESLDETQYTSRC